MYDVTAAGHAEVAAWFATPVARTQPPRDELAIKLALAVTVPGSTSAPSSSGSALRP